MLDPKKTAVVMIEFQHDFTTEDGALHGAVKEVMDNRNILQNAQEVVAKAQQKGATIIHAPISFAEGYP
jgi:nicotinamidase-related amidase